MVWWDCGKRGKIRRGKKKEWRVKGKGRGQELMELII